MNNAKIITQEISQLLYNATLFSFLGAKVRSLRGALRLGAIFSACAAKSTYASSLYMEVDGALVFKFLAVVLAHKLAHSQNVSWHVIERITYLNLLSDKGSFALMHA